MKNTIKHLPKLFILCLFFTLVNCEKEDETIIQDTQTIEKPDSGLKSRKVTLDQLPNLNRFVNQKFSNKQRNANGTDYVVTNFGDVTLDDIIEVIDTMGNINYTFAILPKRIQQNKFFNFIVHQYPESSETTSYILEYDMDEDFANSYRNNDLELKDFKGTVRKYSLEAFSNRNMQRTACEEDTEGDDDSEAIPCIEIEINNEGENGDDDNDPDGGDGDDGDDTNDGSDGGGGGESSGEGPGNGGPPGPGGSEIIGINTTTITVCCSSNFCNPHAANSQGAPCSGTSEITITEVVLNFKSMRNLDCEGEGSSAIIPVPFDKLNLALDLSIGQSDCLDANCEFKNEMRDYLDQNKDAEGQYTDEAKAFAKAAVLELGTGTECTLDFEVDWINKIIKDPTFNNTKADCVYELLGSTDNNLFNDVISAFTNNKSKFKLKFQIGDVPAGADGSTNYDPTTDIITITFPPAINSKTTLEIASILLHEGIHAELRRIYQGNNQVPEPLSTSQFNYLVSLWEHYIGISPASSVSNNASHTFMVYNHVEPLANAIRELDNNSYDLDHYMWFGWDGLSQIGKITSPPLLTTEEANNFLDLHLIPINDNIMQSCDE